MPHGQQKARELPDHNYLILQMKQHVDRSSVRWQPPFTTQLGVTHSIRSDCRLFALIVIFYHTVLPSGTKYIAQHGEAHHVPLQRTRPCSTDTVMQAPHVPHRAYPYLHRTLHRPVRFSYWKHRLALAIHPFGSDRATPAGSAPARFRKQDIRINIEEGCLFAQKRKIITAVHVLRAPSVREM